MNNQTTFLTNEDLLEKAPSIFASHPAQEVSDKYQFVKTIDVVEHLRNHDWMPVKAEQQRSRASDGGIYSKHLIRFRKSDSVPVLNSTHFEVVLINSHNRSCTYQFHAGLFRLVCMNGMVVADSTLQAIHVKHIGDLSEIQEATYEIINNIPKVAEQVNRFSEIQLTSAQQSAYAESALMLRYDDATMIPIGVESLLTVQRSDDRANDLWHTFNRVQENLTQGMSNRYSIRDENGNRKRKMTAVKSINENTKLNKALWALTEKMAELA